MRDLNNFTWNSKPRFCCVRKFLNKTSSFQPESQSRSQTKWPPASLQASVSVIQCHWSYRGIPFMPHVSNSRSFQVVFALGRNFTHFSELGQNRNLVGLLHLRNRRLSCGGREWISICINVLDWFMWQKWADSIHPPGRGWSAQDFRSGASGRSTRQRWERARPVCGSEVRTPAPDLQPLC